MLEISFSNPFYWIIVIPLAIVTLRLGCINDKHRKNTEGEEERNE